MRGYLLLTEARSGSNWLGSMATSSGTMGIQSEWLDKPHSGVDMSTTAIDDFFEAVLAKASTANGRFAISLFPRYLFKFREAYGTDFIDECRRRHDVVLISLRRRDVMRQAISFAKARQTKQYGISAPAVREAKYDFEHIAKCYFYIRNSSAFWDSYLDLRGFDVDRFIYEDLVGNEQEFIRTLAKRLDVDEPTGLKTKGSVQGNDALTQDWLQRFKSDLSTLSPLGSYDYRTPIKRSPKNMFRLINRTLTSRYPFQY